MTTLVTLPSDITIKIFTTLTVDLGDAPPEPVVLRLSSICKSLRDLVINSPTLWSRIRLRSFCDVNGVSLFIQRSRQCLLEVSVYFDFFGHFEPEMIQSCAVTRWRKLTVRGPLSSEVKTFLQAIMGTPTPNLTEVRLLPREQSDCNGHHCPLLSGASDALRALTMRGCVSCLALPFPNLTKLNIFRLSCSYEEFRNLIQGSPNLTTLILGELQDHFPAETFSEPVISHRPLIEALSIRYFAVGFTNANLILAEVQPLLAFLSMPNLEYLEIVGSRADYGELCGKPFPELKKLCLRDMNASDAALYRTFTKITSLELNNIEGLELLAAPAENGATSWPHLQTLRCGFWYEDNCAWLDKLLDRRPRLTLEVPIEHKDDVVAISSHDVRFFSDELSGLIRVEDFRRTGWEDEEDWTDSDFSDQVDPFEFEDGDNWDFEYDGMEDEVDDVDDYFEEDDDGLEGVEGWY